ncbi:choice-of-anchor D domain-containing protein [Raineya sp.]
MRHKYFTSWKNYFWTWLLLLTASASWGQVSSTYIFSQATGTYTPITGGTVLATGTFDDAFYTQAIPSFTFNGSPFTSVFVGSNGWLQFGGTGSATNYNPISSTNVATGIIAPMGRDLQNATGGEIRYQQIGSELIFQWTNVKRFGTSYNGEIINFQVRLNIGTGEIRVVYGSYTPPTTPPGSPVHPQVGLRGTTNADFNNRTTTTNWAASTAGAVNTATMTLTATVFPASGLTFIWAPPAPCTGTPPTLTASVSPTSACVGSPISLSVPPVSALNITYQWQYSTDGGSTWNNITGATSANSTTSMPAVSAVFRCLVTCTNSAQTTPSTTTSAVSPTGAPTYATLPYTQNFEATWQSSACVTAPIAEDRPDNSWVNTPSSGNQSWRQDNRGDIASVSGWTFTGNGLYSPTGANGTSRSARFHTYGASSGTQGTLDLYINLSSTTLSKALSFYYINTSGTDNLAVLISTDGGFSFTPLVTSPANPLVVQTQWTLVTATITSNSPTTVIRFRATSDFGVTDIGLDEINIIVPPDIEVRGIDNSVIPNGSVVTSLVNGTDFGTISVASTPFLDRTFTIANPGTQPLNISSVTSSNANFVIQTNPSSPVVAGTTTFTVRFQPTTFGTFNSTISIVNNVPGKTPYTFRVTGTATAPTIAVSGLGNNIPNNKTLTMASDGTFLGVGNNLTSTFTITNNGNENLAINSITFPSGSAFSASGVPTSVAANGGTADFNVSFNPANGAKIDTVIIRSNAANAPTFRFLVSAGGVVSALDLNDAELHISPNPSNGIFNVKINNPIYNNISAVVYDVSGRAVQTYQVPQFNGSMNVDLSRLEKGTYILLIETNGERVARKLIKQ